MRRFNLIGEVLIIVFAAELCIASTSKHNSAEIIPVEVFQVHQLPVTLSNVELVQIGNTYQLRCSISNNSDEKLLGFRFSLVAVGADHAMKLLANRSEAVTLTSYTTKRKTFRTSLNGNLKDHGRLIFMLEQIVGSESIWEVVKAKDALQAYVSGDYSIVPAVLRAPNHVDVSPQQRLIY